MRPEGLAVLGVPLDAAEDPAGVSAEAGRRDAGDAAIDASPEARAYWETLAPGYRRRYLGWIMSAKQEETRKNRLSRVIGFLEEGRNSVMV